MEEMKISEIYDPMELANDLQNLLKSCADDEHLMEIHYGATEIVSDIMNAIGNNPQAIRGAAIIASTLMTILTEMPRNLESEQREMEYCYKFITTGLPALLLNVLTHENVINAKNSLEGVPKL